MGGPIGARRPLDDKFVLSGSIRKAGSNPFPCSAWTAVMPTPGAPALIVIVRFAPNPMFELQGCERGTSTSLPAAQEGVAVPRKPAILAPRNVLTSAETSTAEFLPAAISATLE